MCKFEFLDLALIQRNADYLEMHGLQRGHITMYAYLLTLVGVDKS